MREKDFLCAALMAAVLFCSCSNELINPCEKTGTLKLTVAGTPASRATGEEPTQAEENTVETVMVWLFDHTIHNTIMVTEGA